MSESPAPLASESLTPSPVNLSGLDPLSAEAYMALLRVSGDILSHEESQLSRFGLSSGRFTVLMLLRKHVRTGLSPSELAEKAGVTRATMTGLIDGLQRRGLVRREDDVTDRRAYRVHLTETGHATLEDVLPAYFQRIGAIMAPLPAESRRRLVELLGMAEHGLGTIKGSSEPIQSGA